MYELTKDGFRILFDFDDDNVLIVYEFLMHDEEELVRMLVENEDHWKAITE